MADVTLSVVRDANGWAIKHNGGFLGYASSEREAASIARSLLDWVSADGRRAVVEIEPSAGPGAGRVNLEAASGADGRYSASQNLKFPN